ncbi:MAG: cupredoxin domain-containing protein [Actinomycetota bacterium]
MARRVGFALLMFACASLFIAVPSAAGGACHGEGAPTGDVVDGNEVTIDECAFTPQVLHIDPGEEVTFSNKDIFPHTATGSDWGTKALDQGTAATVIFDEAGTFDYFCKFHPGMTGTIVVGDGEPAAAAPATDEGALASGVGEDSGDGVSVFEVGIAILSGLVGFGLGRLTTRVAQAQLGANAVK